MQVLKDYQDSSTQDHGNLVLTMQLVMKTLMLYCMN